jgi:hypothetical protein
MQGRGPALTTGAAIAACLLALAGACAGAEPTDLATEARSLAQAARQQFGDAYTTRIDDGRHLVYVAAVDAKTLEHAVRVLSEHMDAEQRFLFPRPLAWNVTIILPTVTDYRRLVPAETQAYGQYRPAARTLVSLSLSDVLFHEFTHALHHNDQALAGQAHAIWIAEGLATLFQRAPVRKGRLEPEVCNRLETLQQAVRDGKTSPLADLCSMDQAAFLRRREVHYLQARYVMLYLHRAGRLKEFYESYKAGYAADPSGRAALEKTLGKPAPEIDADWRAWVLAQEAPWKPTRPSRAHLGVRMAEAEQGVKVTGFVRGSAAEREARLKVGDVITALAGRATPTPQDLTQAVQACDPGQVVDVEVLRDGVPTIVSQLLGVMPP